MAKGTNYGTESVQMMDPQTGAEILQLTNNPTVSSNLYFENVNFTQDSKTVLFTSKRNAGRDAPSDLYRCDVNGRNLIQLTDRDGVGGACLSYDGTHALFTVRNEVWAVDMSTYEEHMLAKFDDAVGVGNLSVGGEWIFGGSRYSDGTTGVVRCNASGGGETKLRTVGSISHVNASRSGNWLAWIDTSIVNEYDTQTWFVMRPDGSDNHRWAIQNWAHSAWIGETDRMQGTLLPPAHGIAACSAEDTSEDQAQRIVSGPYFWHSSASMDGNWVVSDTNWPDIGLQLVHVPSGRFATLCLSGGTNSNHPNHPHPAFSPDGTKVLYNSDRTGVPQVYIVVVPDWLRDELETGTLLARYKVARR
jgi:Tol biopolymer transport system component